MRVLLIQDHNELRERLSFAIESAYGSTVRDVAELNDAFLATSEPDFSVDLVIFDLAESLPKARHDFFKRLGKTPVIFCVRSEAELKEKPEYPGIVATLERSKLLESIVPVIEGLIEKNVLERDNAGRDFCRIKTKLLLSVCPLKGDIYIRLSDWKFVKLFHQGDVFDKADMEKYTVQKGVQYLYIRNEQCKEFVEKYTADLKKLLDSRALSVAAASKTSETAFETIQQLGERVGFTKEVQELTKTQVQVAVKSMGKSPTLAGMLAQLKKEQGKYIATHSSMTAYLACAIATQMGWGSDITYFKLTLASFLHDITLKNHELAAYDSLEDVMKDKAKFSPADVNEYKMHPVRSAEIARQFNEVPPDVDVIIFQHHERPDGSGFPRKLTQNYIAPLTCLFIVAHDLAKLTLASDTINLQEFIAVSKDKYKSSGFKKVFAAMEGMVQE